MATTTLVLSRADAFNRPSGIQRDNPEQAVSFTDVTLPADFSGDPVLVIAAEVGHERLLRVITDQDCEVVLTRAGQPSSEPVVTPVFAPAAGGFAEMKVLVTGAISNVYVKAPDA